MLNPTEWTPADNPKVRIIYVWDDESSTEDRKHLVTHHQVQGANAGSRLAHPFNVEDITHETSDGDIIQLNPTGCDITHSALHVVRNHRLFQKNRIED